MHSAFLGQEFGLHFVKDEQPSFIVPKETIVGSSDFLLTEFRIFKLNKYYEKRKCGIINFTNGNPATINLTKRLSQMSILNHE